MCLPVKPHCQIGLNSRKKCCKLSGPWPISLQYCCYICFFWLLSIQKLVWIKLHRHPCFKSELACEINWICLVGVCKFHKIHMSMRMKYKKHEFLQDVCLGLSKKTRLWEIEKIRQRYENGCSLDAIIYSEIIDAQNILTKMCGENQQKLINKRDLEFILLDLIWIIFL